MLPCLTWASKREGENEGSKSPQVSSEAPCRQPSHGLFYFYLRQNQLKNGGKTWQDFLQRDGDHYSLDMKHSVSTALYGSGTKQTSTGPAFKNPTYLDLHLYLECFTATNLNIPFATETVHYVDRITSPLMSIMYKAQAR